RVVESTVFSQTYDPQTIDFLKDIIIPSKKKNAIVDKAFGVFLGYSLGLKPSNLSTAEFRTEFAKKMDTDIKAHVAYIVNKIKTENLGNHSFYFYILPFNDADNEKQSIMNTVLGGGY
ncbi:MAG TPA: Hachiman antiphage defense system protein HamA, partial [Atribacterota bacterium]|nr:Hachiman antiphage defense system protein HamA [Atribacterota bacterium]